MTAGRFLPYSRQEIDESDIEAVVEVLRSDFLTTGPRVGAFEDAFATAVGAKHAIAVSNGTAALHAAVHAAGVSKNDEVIVPPITFVATANCVAYCGATPVFADVLPETLLLDPSQVEARITDRTRAIICVDFAGQPCDYDALRELARKRGLVLIADACHSLGGSHRGRLVGTLADLNTFSFHPVKAIATGEGGMVTTEDDEFDRKIRAFRNHGITADHSQRSAAGTFEYQMLSLGYNYRITDFQCALGQSQLRKLPGFLEKRRMLAQCYDRVLADIPWVRPLGRAIDVEHAYHLYVVLLDTEALGMDRDRAFRELRAGNIGVNVHYKPVHLQPFYQYEYGTRSGDCPVAEAAFDQLLTLPLHPGMSSDDLEDVVRALRRLDPQGVV